ncbi:MAG: RHS repeat-associated core domain-containing protein [Armatimonadetes bacterium]|nr:RHS repeat-associated core domain-containing protein [Armatimonadota bacterium]MDE2206166.1 RHS repeat-associated core domain-containing protein [Armatimonadota bacterium]
MSGTATDPYSGFGSQYGYYSDSETGLQLLGYRYYDPAEGRFVNRDPIGMAGGVNVYGYVRNDPPVFVDGRGTQAEDVEPDDGLGADGPGGEDGDGGLDYDPPLPSLPFSDLDPEVFPRAPEHRHGARPPYLFSPRGSLLPGPELPDPNEPDEPPFPGWYRKGPGRRWWSPDGNMWMFPDGVGGEHEDDPHWVVCFYDRKNGRKWVGRMYPDGGWWYKEGSWIPE